MLEHQNEHFVRDFLQFSHFVASESTFSYEFSCEPQNRCFVRGFRQLSAHLTKCHAVRLPHKTTFHTLRNTSECHEVPRLPRGTKHHDMWNLQKWPLFAELTAISPLISAISPFIRSLGLTTFQFILLINPHWSHENPRWMVTSSPLNIVKFQVGKFHLAPIKHMSLSENRMPQNPAADSWLYYDFC